MELISEILRRLQSGGSLRDHGGGGREGRDEVDRGGVERSQEVSENHHVGSLSRYRHRHQDPRGDRGGDVRPGVGAGAGVSLQQDGGRAEPLQDRPLDCLDHWNCKYFFQFLCYQSLLIRTLRRLSD